LRLALAGLAVAVAAGGGFLAGRSVGAEAGSRWVQVERAAVGGLAKPSGWTPPALAERPVRNVVLLVGDGMGLAQIAAARLRAFGPDGRFVMDRLPVTGLRSTEPEGAIVTSSDAAATAMASGERTLIGRVGTAPDGKRRLSSVLEAARAAGFVAGLVTTSWIYDATPAAFAAHVAARKDYAGIVEQLASSGVDLLAGGGRERFSSLTQGGSRVDGRDLLAEARGRGIAVVTDVAALARADRLPLWALFPGKTLGEEPRHPTLGELSSKAIDLVAAEAHRRGRGFFLLLEEEGVDTAGHARDLEAMTRAVLHLDQAVEAAARFAAADGETLVLVTADHSTGGLTIDADSTARELVVVWASNHHDGEPVPLFAYGPPGAAAGFTGFAPSTDLPHRVGRLLGLAGW
jgi:alkaline phosphatase